jgi:PAS domain S-box-containing protein
LLAAQAAISLENTRLYGDLQEREAKVRRLVDSNIVGILIWALDGRVVEANEAFLRMVGYSRDDLVSGHVRWPEMTPAEWVAVSGRAMAELKASGSCKTFEKEYFRKDGSRVPVLIGATSFGEGRDQGVAFVLDLTEHKRAEEALRESEERWRAVFENNPAMYFMVDAASTIVSVNPFGAEQLGYTVHELVGHPVLNVVHEADRDAVQRNVAACLEQIGRTMTWEFRKLRKDGTMLWARETARAMLIKNRPLALIVSEDVSERKRAEYLTQQMFEKPPDRMSIVGRDYRYQRVNPAFARKWGMPAEKIVGMHVAELMGMESFEQTIKAHLDECFAGEEVSYAEWFTLSHGRCYLAVSHSPLRPSPERVEAALVIIRDLTEHMLASEALRKTQMELAHVNRVTTMGQLTASIAHEVNQPIAAAVTNAGAGLRWLAAQPPNLDKVQDTFNSIIKAGTQAGEVIGHIRALIKRVPTRKTNLDINETILETIALTRGEMGRHSILLQTELANDLPSVWGDRVQLQQVMLNLIMNGIEAMSEISERSRVLLIGSSADVPDGVIVTVQDSGPGLTPESLDHIFDPFYTTKHTGMGMGLSICRSIVEEHGGRLWVTANAPRGANFQFTLHQIDAS